LAQGYDRSPTFRWLVDTLNAAPVLVYVQPGRCRRNNPEPLNGCGFAVGTIEGIQHFRIIVDVGGSRDRLLATIGHELQHAVETVTGSQDDVPAGRDVVETVAARRVAATILRELRAPVPR
jgi:hypothetical protein